MRIICHHPNCEICKVVDCILKKPCSKELLDLEKEIAFELQNLNRIRKSIKYALKDSGHYVPDLGSLLQEKADTEEIIRELRRQEHGVHNS